MIEDNNMLLKGLNIDEQRVNDEKNMDFSPTDKNNVYSPRNQNPNKISYNSHSNKNIDKEALHPYGLSLPFKNNNIPEK